MRNHFDWIHGPTCTLIRGEDTGQVTEDTSNFLIATGKLSTQDADEDEAGFRASIIKGSTGTLTLQSSGSWQYKADNSDSSIQSLGAGVSKLEVFTVKSIDGTSHQIKITVNGVNDAAEIGGVDKGSVIEDTDVTKSGDLVTSGLLTIQDVDLGEAYFQAGSQSGALGQLTLDKSGHWDYKVSNEEASIQLLNAGKNIAETFTVKSYDGTEHQIKITVHGVDEPLTLPNAKISGDVSGTVTEDTKVSNGNLIANGKLTITDPELDEAFFIASTQNSKLGSLTIDTAGNWSYKADNSQSEIQGLGSKSSLQDIFDIESVDGTQQQITLTINGVNDVAQIGGDISGAVTEDTKISGGNLTASGKLSITDLDAGEAEFMASSQNGNFGTLTLSKDGSWDYAALNSQTGIQELGAGDKAQDIFTIQSVDGTQQQITLTINGVNDPAVIKGVSTGSVTEDLNLVNGNLVTKGTLLITDVDTGEEAFKAETINKSLGSLTIDTAGNWVYTANNNQNGIQSLALNKTVEEIFTVESVDGSQQQITLTINGVNDPAVIGGVKTGSVTEDVNVSKSGNLVASGALTITDVDVGEAIFVKSTQSSALGSLTFDSAGNWLYEASNKLAAIQGLNLGQSLTDTFTVNSIDGTTAQIKITINGTNEVPPVLLDLNHDGKISLISVADSQVTLGTFEPSAENEKLAMGWVGPEDGILVYDPLGLGTVTELKQISLASYTIAEDSDLEGLRSFDSNHDLRLDQQDEAYSHFGVWQDLNSNGIVDSGEYATLSERGITAISLVSDHQSEIIEGNEVLGYTTYETTDGNQYLAADVELRLEAKAAPEPEPQYAWYNIFSYAQEPLDGS